MRNFFKISLISVAVSVVAIILAPSNVLANHGSIKRDAIDSSYNSRIIDDALFIQSSSMSEAAIQKFLEDKMPRCQSGYTCLKDYVDSSVNKKASKIIYEQAQRVGLNPKVILVTLQKEQSLVTDDFPYAIQYKTAMGYGCPESQSTCDSEYYGFYNQVRLGAQLLRVGHDRSCGNTTSFPGWSTNYPEELKAGNTTNPNVSPYRIDGKSTYIGTCATSSLYNYTPHRPDSAYLQAADGNHYYGNYNFIYFFTNWFGPPTGVYTPFFRRVCDPDPVYVLGSNNNYYHVTSRRALEAYGLGTTISRIAGAKCSYTNGLTFSGALPLIARFQGDEVYLLDKGQAHWASSWNLLKTFGYSAGSEATLPDTMKFYYPTTAPLESIVRNANGPEVYSIESSKKRHIINGEAYFSGDPSYSSRPEVSLSSDFLASVAPGAPILTSNKILQRSDKSSLFGYWNGSYLQNILRQTVLELGLTADYSSSSAAINQLPLNGSNIEKLVKSSEGQLYLLDNRQKLLVSSSDLANLNLSTASFTLTSNEFLDRAGPAHSFLPAFRINNGAEVYLVKNGQRHHVDDVLALNENGYSIKQVINVNQSSADLFPDSGRKILSLGTLFRVNSTAAVYIVNNPESSLYIPSKALVADYGWQFNVRNFSSSHVSNYPNTSTLNYFIKDAENNVWLIQSKGVKRSVSVSMQGSSIYAINAATLPLLNNRLLDGFHLEGPLTELIRATGNAKVYKVENGAKRWITTSAKFYELGYSNSNVTAVSPAFTASLPTGADIE